MACGEVGVCVRVFVVMVRGVGSRLAVLVGREGGVGLSVSVLVVIGQGGCSSQNQQSLYLSLLFFSMF